jgi:two-component system nitrogen regulation sensor histidine kinase NtrY
VLSGVSAGVLALDKEARVTLINRPAQAMLQREESTEPAGAHVAQMLPGIEELLAKVQERPGALTQGTLHLQRPDCNVSLHVRLSADAGAEGGVSGYIVTFDDITPLIAAQRHAAWSDVARRVAHEIKNPLTPIALAAERLKRKYLKYVEEGEAEQFSRYTDTIARHVSEIGRMVDEFAAFARMPNPVFKQEELAALIRKAVFSEQVAHAPITYSVHAPQAPVYWTCDSRQITQALSNLLKNAAESFEAFVSDPPRAPCIEVHLECAQDALHITVCDNGPGFPPGETQKMLEPYVTTRAKGTGLGLAIVRKIVEDHQGRISLSNGAEGGAIVTLSFPVQCGINAA